MNKDMEHQQLRELNRKAEKKRMEEFERHAAPFFYVLIVVVIGLVLWVVW